MLFLRSSFRSIYPNSSGGRPQDEGATLLATEEAVLTERRRGYIVECFGGHGGTKSRRGGSQGGRGGDSVIYFYYCKKSGHTKYECPFLKGKPARCTYGLSGWRAVATSVWAILDVPTITKHTSSFSLFLCTLAQTCTSLSCLLPSMSHT